MKIHLAPGRQRTTAVCPIKNYNTSFTGIKLLLNSKAPDGQGLLLTNYKPKL